VSRCGNDESDELQGFLATVHFVPAEYPLLATGLVGGHPLVREHEIPVLMPLQISGGAFKVPPRIVELSDGDGCPVFEVRRVELGVTPIRVDHFRSRFHFYSSKFRLIYKTYNYRLF